jgi:hypothetical protein
LRPRWLFIGIPWRRNGSHRSFDASEKDWNMVAETVAPRASAAFPENWHANLPPGPPFELDAMHFPFPVSPLSASHSRGAGFVTALREYQVPVTHMGSVFRNHYRFSRMVMAQLRSEAEAAELFGPAESAIAAEVGRLL